LGVQRTLFALPPESLLDEVAGHAGQGSHAFGQFPGAAKGGHLLGKELLKQVADGLSAASGLLDSAVPCDGGQAGRLPMFALDVPAELQVVSQDQVVEGSAVAAKLLGPLRCVQAGADVLGLDVADGCPGAGEDVIGCAALHALGLVDGLHSVTEGLEQGLQSRAVGELGG
jgi:hypothetical protein